jgi:biotin-dependent carboxylase-like uncharacterized protein
MVDMPFMKVKSPGFLTTVQDLGRPGYAHVGVSASGAADTLALRVGNLLVGNPESAAALEMTLVGGEFEFEERCVAALTGSDFQPALNGHQVPLWRSLDIPAGGTLKLGATRDGARCYLCVAGGIRVEPVFGSSSTHVLTQLGGWMGRPLKAGDQLPLGQPKSRTSHQDRSAPSQLVRLWNFGNGGRTIRVTPGPQIDYFPEEARLLFGSSTYAVTEESNRMGLRLRGPALAHASTAEMVTEGVSLGAIQVPQNGEPIILFVEHQTTGGYPKIANVVSADMHLVGQLRPRNQVRFEFVSLEKALLLLREQESLIQPQSFLPA